MNHAGDAGGIPAADILVERRCIGEHPVHAGDAGGIPAADVSVERVRFVEHLKISQVNYILAASGIIQVTNRIPRVEKIRVTIRIVTQPCR